MMIDSFFSSHLIEAIGWSLLHSLWQGTLLALLLALLLLLMKKFSSQTRYLIIALFMALFVAALPVNVIRLYEPVAHQPPPVIDKVQAFPATAIPFSISKQQVSDTMASEVSMEFTSYFERHLPLIVTLWLMGILLLLLRYLGQLLYLQRLKHHGIVSFPTKWMQLIARLEAKVNLSRKVKYLESLRITTPLTIGWLKPVVLFPIGLLTRLTVEEVEVILLHELAHIKRNDYFFHVLESLARILLFYHPSIYWMSNLLDRERENCCDDLVVALTGEREKYASTLIHLQEQKLQSMKTALSITGTSASFSGRILRLLNHSFTSANRFGEGFATALVLVAGLGFLTAAGFRDTPRPSSNASTLQTNFTEEDQEKVDLLIKLLAKILRLLFSGSIRHCKYLQLGKNASQTFSFCFCKGQIGF